MSVERIIPVTPIWRRYQDLRTSAQRDRLKEAQWLLQYPEVLANEFAESVMHFASYANSEEAFYPPERAKRRYDEGGINRTNDLVLRLEHQQRLAPTDAPNRMNKHDAGTTVTDVPARLLACDYVDRELLVQRTTSPARWEDGSSNGGGLRLDVLLADSADRTPIVGELKLPGDMDPFFALVQALACAAHLATRPQYERMRRHLTRGKFPDLTAAPRLDVWVLFLEAPAHRPGQSPKGRYMANLQSAAEALAPLLLAQDAIQHSVRRIAGLGMKPDVSGLVVPEVYWAWGPSGDERTAERGAERSSTGSTSF
jgi:hypothetical protein